MAPLASVQASTKSRSDTVPNAAGIVGLTDEWVATVLARPLFDQSRMPPVGVNMAADVKNEPRLSGIIIGPAGKMTIFILANGNPVVVAEGGEVGSYTVRDIGTAGVTVIGPSGIRLLHPAFAAEASSGAEGGPLPPAGPAAPLAALAAALERPDWLQPGPPLLPNAATWSGAPTLSRLPSAPPQAASTPLLSPAPGQIAPP